MISVTPRNRNKNVRLSVIKNYLQERDLETLKTLNYFSAKKEPSNIERAISNLKIGGIKDQDLNFGDRVFIQWKEYNKINYLVSEGILVNRNSDEDKVEQILLNESIKYKDDQGIVFKICPPFIENKSSFQNKNLTQASGFLLMQTRTNKYIALKQIESSYLKKFSETFIMVLVSRFEEASVFSLQSNKNANDKYNIMSNSPYILRENLLRITVSLKVPINSYWPGKVVKQKENRFMFYFSKLESNNLCQESSSISYLTSGSICYFKTIENNIYLNDTGNKTVLTKTKNLSLQQDTKNSDDLKLSTSEIKYNDCFLGYTQKTASSLNQLWEISFGIFQEPSYLYNTSSVTVRNLLTRQVLSLSNNSLILIQDQKNKMGEYLNLSNKYYFFQKSFVSTDKPVTPFSKQGSKILIANNSDFRIEKVNSDLEKTIKSVFDLNEGLRRYYKFFLTWILEKPLGKQRKKDSELLVNYVINFIDLNKKKESYTLQLQGIKSLFESIVNIITDANKEYKQNTKFLFSIFEELDFNLILMNLISCCYTFEVELVLTINNIKLDELSFFNKINTLLNLKDIKSKCNLRSQILIDLYESLRVVLLKFINTLIMNNYTLTFTNDYTIKKLMKFCLIENFENIFLFKYIFELALKSRDLANYVYLMVDGYFKNYNFVSNSSTLSSKLIEKYLIKQINFLTEFDNNFKSEIINIDLKLQYCFKEKKECLENPNMPIIQDCSQSFEVFTRTINEILFNTVSFKTSEKKSKKSIRLNSAFDKNKNKIFSLKTKERYSIVIEVNSKIHSRFNNHEEGINNLKSSKMDMIFEMELNSIIPNSNIDFICSNILNLKTKIIKSIFKFSSNNSKLFDVNDILKVLSSKDLFQNESLVLIPVLKITLFSLKQLFKKQIKFIAKTIEESDENNNLIMIHKYLRIYIYESIQNIFSPFIQNTNANQIKYKLSYYGVKFILFMLRKVDIQIADIAIIEKILIKLLSFCINFISKNSDEIQIQSNNKILKIVFKMVLVIIKALKQSINTGIKYFKRSQLGDNSSNIFLFDQLNNNSNSDSKLFNKEIKLLKFKELMSSTINKKKIHLINIKDSELLSTDSHMFITILLKEIDRVRDIFEKVNQIIREISQNIQKLEFKKITNLIDEINFGMFDLIFLTISYQNSDYNFLQINLNNDNKLDLTNLVINPLQKFNSKYLKTNNVESDVIILLDNFVQFLKSDQLNNFNDTIKICCRLKIIFCNFMNFILYCNNTGTQNKEIVQKIIDIATEYFIPNQNILTLVYQFLKPFMDFLINKNYQSIKFFNVILNNLKDSYYLFMIISELNDLYLNCNHFDNDYLKQRKRVIVLFCNIIVEIEPSLKKYSLEIIYSLIIEKQFLDNLKNIDQDILCNKNFYYLLKLYILISKYKKTLGAPICEINCYLEKAIYLIKKTTIPIKFRIRLTECVFETIILVNLNKIEVLFTFFNEIFESLLSEINQTFGSRSINKDLKFNLNNTVIDERIAKKTIIFKIKNGEISGFLIVALNILSPLINHLIVNPQQIKLFGFNLNNLQKDIGTLLNINASLIKMDDLNVKGLIDLMTYRILDNELSRRWNIINIYLNKISGIFDSKKGSFAVKDVYSNSAVSENHDYKDSNLLSQTAEIIIFSGLSLKYYLNNILSDNSMTLLNIFKLSKLKKEESDLQINLISLNTLDNQLIGKSKSDYLKIIIQEFCLLLFDLEKENILFDYFYSPVLIPIIDIIVGSNFELQNKNMDYQTNNFNYLKKLLLDSFWQKNQISKFVYRLVEQNPKILELILHIINSKFSNNENVFLSPDQICDILDKSNSFEIINQVILNLKNQIKLCIKNNNNLYVNKFKIYEIQNILKRINLILKYLMNQLEKKESKYFKLHLRCIKNIFFVFLNLSGYLINRVSLITSHDCFSLLEVIVLNKNSKSFKLDRLKSKLTDFIFVFFENIVNEDNSDQILTQMTSKVFFLISKILNLISTNDISNKTQMIMLFNLSKILKKLLHDQHYTEDTKANLNDKSSRLEYVINSIDNVYKNLNMKQVGYFHQDQICSLNSKLINNQKCSCSFKECLEKKCSIFVFCIIKSCFEYFQILKKSQNPNSFCKLYFYQEFKNKEIFVELKIEDSITMYSFQKNLLFFYATDRLILRFNNDLLKAKQNKDYDMIFRKMDYFMEKLILQKYLNHFSIILFYNKINQVIKWYAFGLYILYMIYIYITSTFWEVSDLVQCLFCFYKNGSLFLIQIIHFIISVTILFVNAFRFGCKLALLLLKEKKRHHDKNIIIQNKENSEYFIFEIIKKIFGKTKLVLTEFILSILTLCFPFCVFVLILIRTLNLPKVKLYLFTVFSNIINLFLIFLFSLVFIFFLLSITNLVIIIPSDKDYNGFFTRLKYLLFTNTIYRGQENYMNLDPESFNYLNTVLISFVIIFKWIFCPLVFALFFHKTFVYLETINKIDIDLKSYCCVCKLSKHEILMNNENFEKHITNKHNVKNYFFLFMHLSFHGQSQNSNKTKKLIEQCAGGDFSFMVVK